MSRHQLDMVENSTEDPDLQWVKVVGKPEYSFSNGHAHLVLKADSGVPVKQPKDVMLY
jgi:hypothetical protein